MILRFICSFVFFLAAVPVGAGQASVDATSAENDRLFAVIKIWSTIKYFHPYLAYRPIDWDKALVDAVPSIRNARSTAEYSAGASQMLSVLQDPLSRVLAAGEKIEIPTDVSPQRSWIHSGLPAFSNGWPGFYSALLNKPPAQVAVMSQPIGSDLSVSIRLSEPVGNGSVPAFPTQERDRPYDEDALPTTELRVLAASRLWGAVHYFYAYKDLMDEDWDAAFQRLLPKFIAAKDAREYHLAVSELVKTLADSHATVQSAELTRYFGQSPVGLRVRLVERKLVITEVLDAEAKSKGLKVGDLIAKVDGESVPDRVNRQASLLSASTQQGLGVQVCQRVLNGPEDSVAALTITTAGAVTKNISLKRNARYLVPLATQRSGEIVRILKGNIGYIDLDRLEENGVEGALARLQSSAGIIFDLRGRFGPSVASIASRLTSKHNLTALIVNGPILIEPDAPHSGSDSYSASYLSSTAVPDSNLPKYKGKTVMLVDERTSDHAEEAALYFEAANRTEFVGTPSAGVAGKSTNLALPGGILVSFSGQDVRHSNGGPLQRLGLQPSVSAPPSLAVIRSGRDEVLEKALESFTAQ